ncbi:MAG: cbb3-type cytochrome c oxidase subunit 3 [Salaquimonas sp.]|jgi:cytochrome c oxidase cbb3-type subunit 4|nr:cbb3-type cytochrome c oxidase subunit 3 [Salaquimonas sp.]
MDYHVLRHFADSYWLIFMVALFVGIVAWIFLRPGSKKSADEAAQIPLKEDGDNEQDGN